MAHKFLYSEGIGILPFHRIRNNIPRYLERGIGVGALRKRSKIVNRIPQKPQNAYQSESQPSNLKWNLKFSRPEINHSIPSLKWRNFAVKGARKSFVWAYKNSISQNPIVARETKVFLLGYKLSMYTKLFTLFDAAIRATTFMLLLFRCLLKFRIPQIAPRNTTKTFSASPQTTFK